jgi:CheY-like chemotaxis protein
MLYQSQQSITDTILVADDNPANRELLNELLTTQGFRVVTVPNGVAAVAELTRTQIDLVLLDVLMPHLNGFEVCEQIKSNPETYLTPVVMITALSDKQARIRGIEAGADDFLSRPFGAPDHPSPSRETRWIGTLMDFEAMRFRLLRECCKSSMFTML